MTDSVWRAELQQLYADDYQQHSEVPAVGTSAYIALRLRDRQRRQQALALMQKMTTPNAQDFYHLAWLLNHGDDVDEIEQAHFYAKKSAELGHDPACWLSAASYDRARMYRGLPQKFGTQIVPDGKRYRVWDVDPETSDEERAKWHVPPLASQIQRAADLTLTEPQPPMELAPEWLQAALKRWQQTS